MSRIRVLVVDDSLFMRRIISDLLGQDGEIEVVGTARNGVEGLEMARQLQPDVITLDVQMPHMDGIAMLERLMAELPTPVVMISSLTQEGADITMRCLELGAVDFVPKPSGAVSLDLYKVSSQIIEKVKAAARVPRAQLRSSRFAKPALQEERVGTQMGVGKVDGHRQELPLVVIGASTGGPRALSLLMSQLPPDFYAPMLIIQHMPQGFTCSFAKRLNQLAPLSVREAQEGDCIEPGVAYLAPGGSHLQVRQGGVLHLSSEPPLHGVRPAIDVTLFSLAQHYRGKLIVAILTGMGNDGAMGARALHAKGARILAEHESSCIVFGMPRAVIQTGCVDRVVPIEEMAQALTEEVKTLCKSQAA